MNYLKTLICLALMLAPNVAFGQQNTNTLPPTCTAATLLTTCVPQRFGTRAIVRDAASGTVCTGGGATTNTCELGNLGWHVVNSDLIGAGINGESILNVPDGTFDFTRDEAGTVSVTASDDNAVAALSVYPGGAAALTLGSTFATTVNLVTAGDVNVTDQSDGNSDAHAQLVGLPKIVGWTIGASTDGSETVNTDFGDSETPATDWTAVDGDVVVSNDGATYRKGSASLELAVAATSVEEDDGATNALATGDQDWSADESFGMWMRCDSTTSAGDWNLTITDNATDEDVAVPALTAADTWTWLEVDISGVADADKDVITDLGLTLSAAGATAMVGVTCYFDYLWKWDAAEEEALSQSILDDGVLAAWSILTAAGGANTPTVLAEGTNFFIHYESGNDFFVAITDLSTYSVWGMAALE
jgi:hypothetical protein